MASSEPILFTNDSVGDETPSEGLRMLGAAVEPIAGEDAAGLSKLSGEAARVTVRVPNASENALEKSWGCLKLKRGKWKKWVSRRNDGKSLPVLALDSDLKRNGARIRKKKDIPGEMGVDEFEVE
ncbi:hypothetical protein AMTR_s00150p00096550 [Amborella trichopoda]|uniref:Uncharacterized protein n=1 Tax=Amborella trichopoda TaxID=13333 RepID=W1PMR9_AMBTC|nr:hypothetical protein AMTR_s00150p00096550 [Amborella trichopoda]